MTNKMVKYLSFICILFLLVACGQKAPKEEKTYDKEFIQALEKGLEERWNYTDKNAYLDELNSKKGYTTAVDKELSNISKFEDLKFKNSNLKEAAIAYVNVLKKSKEIAHTFGAESFYLNWEENYKHRNEKLIDINAIVPIKVSDKNSYILDELLASGQEVKHVNQQDKTLQELINSITFVKNETESDEFFATYEAIVENNTDLMIDSLSATIKLIDDDGVTVDTQYLNVNNWKAGEKQKFNFTTSETFANIEISIDFKEIKK